MNWKCQPKFLQGKRSCKYHFVRNESPSINVCDIWSFKILPTELWRSLVWRCQHISDYSFNVIMATHLQVLESEIMAQNLEVNNANMYITLQLKLTTCYWKIKCVTVFCCSLYNILSENKEEITDGWFLSENNWPPDTARLLHWEEIPKTDRKSEGNTSFQATLFQANSPHSIQEQATAKVLQGQIFNTMYID
jgi:hypothetical protein